MTVKVTDSAIEPIAIIGMAARFPGARTVAEFWTNLRDGVESVSFFERDELRRTGVAAEVIDHPQYVPARGSLGGVDLFDAEFFGYTPKEAEAMDPQQRLFLECAHAALEDAGYAGSQAVGSIGVYAGCGLNTYLLQNVGSRPDMLQYVGFDKDYLATRASYKLDLKGPSIVVQSACSTSLVAVCQAAQALLTYQCDVALAGGASIHLPDRSGYMYADGSIFSPDGHCRAFDAAGQGIVPGNGVGLVALKRLHDALADGDVIHAVIRGFALNNDGAGKIGYTAPGIEGQTQAIVMAQELAGVPADTISYIEAHGTGTPLGDPVEIAALTRAFRATTDRKGFCAVGSVKTNVGHLDTAAGIASLIKTVLALRHRQLPPSLHFKEPNPKIDFENSPFYVPTRLTPWPAGPTPRRAGVSSFGIGGTNAHVVLEEAPDRESSGPSRPWQILTLSARTPAALERVTTRLASYLEATRDPLPDVAFTLQTGRPRFACRRAIVCRDTADALAAVARMTTLPGGGPVRDGERAVVFMFPGQGTQYFGMGAELYEQEPVFRRAMDDCAALARRDVDIDLRAIIAAGDDLVLGGAADRLEDTRVTQPALFALEYALASLWMSWGVRPAAMIGHSIGEYVAACLAGVLELGDAMRLVCLRAGLMAQAPAGSMLAVGLSETELRRRLGSDLWLAAVNAPTWTVAAGDRTRIAQLEETLVADGVAVQRLHTAGAFHSGLMRGIVEPLGAAVAAVRINAPEIPYISNLTGTWIRGDEVGDPSYWTKHLTEPVRFAAGISELMRFGVHAFLEVGPGQTLGRLVEQCIQGDRTAAAPIVLPSLPAAGVRSSAARTLADAVAALWMDGAALDWQNYYAAERRSRVAAPTYPFERERYWLDAPAAADVGHPRPAAAVQRLQLDAWFSTPSWTRTPPVRAAGDGDCVVFADSAGLGDALADRLRRQGRAAVVVRIGEAAGRTGDDYVIDPSDPQHYEWLVAELGGTEDVPRSVVHCWGVTGFDGPDLTRTECEVRCFFSLLHLVRALAAGDPQAPVRLTVVTDGVHDVTGHERLNPFKALVFGPCRVAPQEYESLECRHIDVALDDRGHDAVANQLAAELDAVATPPTIAYRGIDRWRPSLDPIALPPLDGTPLLREQGVFLITGGFGGIGLEIARLLARTVQPTLVLTSREAFPDRSRWPERLARRTDMRAVRRIHAIQALEALGARVVPVQADVCDEAAMRALVGDVKRDHGRIDGVVHAAGVPAGGVIHLKSAAAAARVLAPKVAGLEVLSRVLEEERPAFIALCSSMTSIVGGFGQADYCAANACLDAFARANTSRRGVHTVAINWDVWRDVGMGVETQVPPEMQAARAAALAQGIAPTEGVETFVRSLHAGVPTVLVSPWPIAQPAVAASVAAVLVSAPAAAARRTRPDIGTPFVPPADGVEETVCRVWADALGVDAVGADDSFFDLGGHSVLAIQVVARLNQRFSTRVPVARLYEGMTPAFFATAVRAALGEAGPELPRAVRRPDRAIEQKQRRERRQAARPTERSAV